jgi:hypothetical protein
LWSAEQQAWLKALGHRVFVLAGDEPVADAFAMEPRSDARPDVRPPHDDVRRLDRPRGLDIPTPAAERIHARPPAAPAENDAGLRRGVAVEIAPAASPRTAPSRAPDDALERALLRATGQRTRSEARALLERLGVDVQALRGNPAAKRTLWLKLRPLRPRLRP